jgi:sugar phosphate isomerase/epimerase
VFDPSIVCCFLHPITRYGYPPAAELTVQYLEEMKALGFQSVELEGIREGHLTEIHARRAEISDALQRLGLAVPYFCAVLPGLSSPDDVEREHNLDLFRLGCETAHVFGSLGILDNAPLPPYRFAEGIPVSRHYDEDVLASASLPDELEWKAYWDELTTTFAEACDIAADFELTYQMHPCLGALSSTADAFLYFRDAVDRNNLRFNLDTANQYALKDNPILALHRLRGHVDYIHLSDNRGRRIEHLVPGDGTIDWDLFFAALDRIGFDGHIGIDVGGGESGVADIDDAYRRSAQWLAEHWNNE